MKGNMDISHIGTALVRHSELVAAGEDDAALAVLREARGAHGFDVGLDQAEWLVLNRTGRLDEMEEVFSRCIANAPNHPTGYVARCWFHFRKGQYEECLVASQTLTQLFPTSYEGYFFSARCLLGLQHPDEALSVYAKLSSHLGDRIEGWLGQAEILQQRGDIESAKEVLKRGLGSVTNRLEMIRRYISLSLIEGHSIRDVSAEVLDDLVSVGGEASETAAFLIDKLRGRIRPEIRRKILENYLDRFPDDLALIEEVIREDFVSNDLSATSISFFRIFSSSGWDRRMTFLWAEYLIRSRKWKDLGEHLSDRAPLIKQSVTDVSSATFILDAIWLCEHYGAPIALGYDDVPQVDVRLTRALAAFRKGDPLDTWDGPLPEWRKRPKPVPYLRTNSFAHSSWMPPVGGTDSRAVETLARDAFFESRPFSVIRLGDGEGDFLNRTMHTISGATARRSETGALVTPRIDDATYADLHSRFVAALHEADVLGIPNEFTIMVSRPMMDSVRYIGEEIPTYRGVFTDNHIHYSMGASGFIERLMAMQMLGGREIYFVGPHDPAQFKELAVPPANFHHIRIPPQIHFFAERMENIAHFPEYFPRVLDALAAMPKHALVLVSAGILGKIYCGVTKANGGFAIDIGAISDHWCGFKTRIAAQNNGRFTSGKTTIEGLIS
jgi:tetratricopeptide (TPR) repeat protein